MCYKSIFTQKYLNGNLKNILLRFPTSFYLFFSIYFGELWIFRDAEIYEF